MGSHFSNKYDITKHPFQFTSPCGERRRTTLQSFALSPKFQSTLPMRGATCRTKTIIPCRKYFNPRSPCGERPTITSADSAMFKFQSTLPMRGATRRFCRLTPHCDISIHAPHAGSDTNILLLYSTPLRFQSTLPMRGATLTHKRV